MSCLKFVTITHNRILVTEEEWFAPHFEAKKIKTLRKEIGYYGGLGKSKGHSYESDGRYGFLQETFEKLINGEVEISESRTGRWNKLIHTSKRYFTSETIEFYNKNK